MGRVERFEDLDVWRRARGLVKWVYAVTKSGEFARDFGLRDQMRRAAVSILSNIAEGFERDGDKEFIQFLSLAKASCGEFRAQLYVALDQSYITPEQFTSANERAIEASRMISGLINYLHQSELRGRKFNLLTLSLDSYFPNSTSPTDLTWDLGLRTWKRCYPH